MSSPIPLTIRLGVANSYLIPAGSGYVLIDAGSPGSEEGVLAAFARRGVDVTDINLIILTHVHGDHAAAAAAIARRSGAPVMVHEAEAPLLAAGTLVAPPGVNLLGRLLSALIGRYVRRQRLEAHQPELVVGEETPLASFGLAGKALHTPGHSPGSLTVLLENGDAFVGDLAMNPLPFGAGSVFPVLAENPDSVHVSWRRLLAAGVRRIYPAHGAPFPAERLLEEMHRQEAGSPGPGWLPAALLSLLVVAIVARRRRG